MQGNKKGTDGLSDSSSIGSLLDDADREVSSLTERAFRSLCISEDTSFSESPDLTRQVLGSLHPKTVSHTHRKSGIWSQLPSQSSEHTGWAATFQQLPKYVQGEENYPKGSPPPTPAQRKLEVPASGLRSSNKPLSKVSSLIKSFDKPESQHGDSRPPPSKPSILKTASKFAPLPESGVNFCFDSAFLTVRRVPAEVSSTHQSGHQPTRKPGEQESPKNLETVSHTSSSFLLDPNDTPSSLVSQFHSSAHKPAKGEPRSAKEWAPKGTFLHSENSAFESWSTHQPWLQKRKDPIEGFPESKGPKYYQDMPLLREPHPPEHKVSPNYMQAGCSQEESRMLTGALSTSRTWGSKDPGAQAFVMEGKAPSSQPEPQGTPTQPPWRKLKIGRISKENLQDTTEEKKQPHKRGHPLYTKQNPQGQFPGDEAPDVPVDSNEHCASFNISKLLTPVIPTKHVLDSLSSQPAERIPSPPGQPNGYQEKAPGEDQFWDSYKSKASCLLFNLKDVRKRVKSTYSPNPLLKGLDEKTRDKVDNKQETVSNGVILPSGLEDSPASQLSNERTSNVTTAFYVSTQEDPRADPNGSSTDNCLTLSSPPSTAKSSICVNGEAAETDSCEQDGAYGEEKLSPTRPGWGPDSRQHSLRKHLSLKLCSQDPEVVKTAEMLQTHQPQNGFSRSVSQDIEPEREASPLNTNSHQQPSPGPLSPEEEDVFYSDSQSDFMPGLQGKAQFSTSSSDQSFASFEDQQKTWYAESQREDRKSDVSAGDSQRDKKERMMEKAGQQCSVLSNGHVRVDEISKEESLQRDGESLSGGTPGKASTEEANCKGSWVGEDKDMALSHTKDFTVAPFSTSNKHILFTIKDNTLRSTPVIKPIMLPLLRTVSSEDSPSGRHKEADLTRPGEYAGLCAPESQVVHGTPASVHLLPTNPHDTHWRHSVHLGPEDHQQAPSTAKTEAFQAVVKGNLPPPPLTGEGEGMNPPPNVTSKVVGSYSKRSSTDQVRLHTPRYIPNIAFPEDNTEDELPPHLLGIRGEEQMQSLKSNLSTLRAGAPGRRSVPGEMQNSPNPSSLERDSACSPTTSSIWDDAFQAPSEVGLPPQEEPPPSSPWANRASVTGQEHLTSLLWEEGSDPQLKPSAEVLRLLSPKGSLLDMATISAAFPERQELPVQPERPVGKPPAVPPKTEKALRRAKKLASKRRKTDQGQRRPDEPREERPWPEDSKRAEQKPPSPKQMPQQPSFPSVRSLPPPMHRHSVSSFPEHSRKQARGPQSAKLLPPHPSTQKILQDPQSGEYFVFDLPLQVKIKTFFDPETGQYFKVPIPSSADSTPEYPLVDSLVDPLQLFPGLRALPVTALTPLRCSSQLSTPTFLWNSRPSTAERTTVGLQSTHEAGLQCALQATRHSIQNAPGQYPTGPPLSPKEEGRDAPSLEIITINDLEDFATEGIS